MHAIAQGMLTAGMIGILLIAQSSSGADVRQLLNQQRFDDAIKVLNQSLKQKENLKERQLLGQILAYQGKTDEAIKTWNAGLKGQAQTDVPLLQMLARIYRQLGEDGPSVERAGGRISYLPSKLSDAEEAAWKQQKWRETVKILQKLQSFGEDVSDQLAEAMDKSGDVNAALALWHSAVKKKPKDAKAATQYAQLLLKQEKHKEARKILEAALPANQRNADLLSLLAQCAEQSGDEDQAKRLREQAEFFEWIPDFCEEIEFNAVNVRLAADLQDRAKIADLVKRLIADPADTASEWMATVCFHHIAHGPIENSCFAELGRRDRGDLLYSLVRNAQSVCTMREGGAALAQIKHPMAYDVLVRALPRDQRPMWSINAANSLALLGDQRAVKPLIRTMAPDFRETSRQRPDRGLLRNGPLLNRVRCALALGHFDTPESRAALQAGVKNPDLLHACHIALYRLTNDKQHLDAMEQGIGKFIPGRRPEMGLIIRELIAIGTADAQRLHDKWKREAEAQRRK